MKNSNFIFIFGIIALSFWALLPLLHPGFFQTDDGEWMIIRFSSFYQALHDGQVPVRFLQRLNFDYGYPVATFLYPGFMYAGVLLHLIKIGFVDTIKIILGISLVSTTLFTYFWLSKLFTKRLPALMGALASLYVPYHLYDVYTRGSVGEVFALMWVPFMLWMSEKKNSFFLSIGILLLILSHNTIALLFLPVIFIYALIRKLFLLKQLCMSFLSGILLASFFIIPVIFELPLSVFSQTSVSNPLQYFANLQLIGISTVVLFCFSIGVFIVKKKNISEYKKLAGFFLIITFISCFFSSPASSFFWQIFPSSFIQFPFRLLSYLVLSLSFLVAFILSSIEKKWMTLGITGGIGLLIIVSCFSYTFPQKYFDKGDGYYATNDATTTVRDEYMPTWVKEKPLQRPQSKIVIDSVGQSNVTNLYYNNKKITFDLSLQRDANVFINTLYWPGWKVYVDNQEAALAFDNPKGVMRVTLSSGNHKVKAEFGETIVRLFADWLSVLTFGGLVFISLRKKARRQTQGKNNNRA